LWSGGDRSAGHGEGRGLVAEPAADSALCLATVILTVGRLIDWRNRWSPT